MTPAKGRIPGIIPLLAVICLLAACTGSRQTGSVNPDATDATAELSSLYDTGGADAALARFREIAAAPDRFSFDEKQLIRLWRRIDREKKNEAAATWAELASGLFPRSDELAAAHGNSLRKCGRRDEAEKILNAALSLNPRQYRAQMGLDQIYIQRNYTKKEYRIPMRDGIKLFTAVYTPRETSRDYPIMMMRTPYSVRPYGEDQYPDLLGPSMFFAHDGFIFVYQDVRGAYMSEGEFVDLRPLETGSGPGYTDEATDTSDTIDWLLKNAPHVSPKVGMWGISYPGGYASMGIVSRHPALVAVSPQAPTTDWFIGDDDHRNGAFCYFPTAEFDGGFGMPRPEPTRERNENILPLPPVDVYRAYLDIGSPLDLDVRYFHGTVQEWNNLIAHPNYDDFWQALSIPRHLKGVRAAVLNVGGLLDAEDPYGPVITYETIEANNPGVENTLVMGPWYHGGWRRVESDTLGDIDFQSREARLYYQEKIEFPFFRYYLKGGDKPDLPDALVFATGSNEWHRFQHWPPENTSTASIYLRENGSLAWNAANEADPAYDEYLSDPARPVPYQGEPSPGWSYGFMHADQRYASSRPDVLVYQSEPLSEDTTLAGPVQAELLVSTTGQDADFIVKIIDVLPDDTEVKSPRNEDLPMGGYEQLVRWGIIRGRFRDSFEKPAPFVPGKITTVSFRVDDLMHTFKKGHRIMVQIHSSWFPLFDRNPQGWVENIYKAKPEDYRKATMRIYRSKQQASRIEVHVLAAEAQ